MSGCVSVIGPPSSICFLKSGTTEPEEPRTFKSNHRKKNIFLFLFLPLSQKIEQQVQ